MHPVQVAVAALTAFAAAAAPLYAQSGPSSATGPVVVEQVPTPRDSGGAPPTGGGAPLSRDAQPITVVSGPITDGSVTPGVPQSRSGPELRAADAVAPGIPEPRAEEQPVAAVDDSGNDNGEGPLCSNPRKEKKVNHGDGYCEDGRYFAYSSKRRDGGSIASSSSGSGKPSISLSLSAQDVAVGNVVNLSVGARDTDGLQRFWWWIIDENGTAITTGDEGPNFVKTCDAAASCSHDWQLRISRVGTFTVRAQALDQKGTYSEWASATIKGV